MTDRRSHPSLVRTDPPLTAGQTDPPRRTAAASSVQLLAANEREHGAAVLSVDGEIDLETVPALRNLLLPVLERETGAVVMDLSEVTFMDSTGVQVLVDALRQLEPQNRRLTIACREGGQVHRLLALIGLLDALPVHRTLTSAVTGGDDLLRSGPARNDRPSEA